MILLLLQSPTVFLLARVTIFMDLLIEPAFRRENVSLTEPHVFNPCVNVNKQETKSKYNFPNSFLDAKSHILRIMPTDLEKKDHILVPDS